MAELQHLRRDGELTVLEPDDMKDVLTSHCKISHQLENCEHGDFSLLWYKVYEKYSDSPRIQPFVTKPRISHTFAERRTQLLSLLLSPPPEYISYQDILVSIVS